MSLQEISEKAVEIGLNELEQEFDKTMKAFEATGNSVEQIRIAGKKFCESYERTQNSYKDSGKRGQAYKGRLETFETDTRKLFDDFQNKINLYFNQLVKVLYVYFDNNGKATLAVTDNSIKALDINIYGSVSYHLKEIEQILKFDDYDSTLLDMTEQSIYARWQVAKRVTKRKNWLPILWHVGTWQGLKVNNLGTIAEAYANFYINKYEFATSSLEHNVANYLLHPLYGARAVDNASGFLIGDVSLEHTQFAVKKDFASPMRMRKVYEAVKNIIDSPVFSPEVLKKKFIDEEKKKAVRNQVSKKIFIELSAEEERIVEELNKTVKNINNI